MAAAGPSGGRRPDDAGPAPRHRRATAPARLAAATRGVVRFGPPLGLMVVVWVLSAQSHLATDLGWIDMVLRKLAHMTEFGLLALLWARAWTWRLDRPERAGPSARAPAHVRARRDAAIVVGAAIAGAWAIVDEVHQSTVDGRVGTPVDVLIDGVGIAAAVVLWIHWPALWRRVRRRLRADPRVRASRAPRR